MTDFILALSVVFITAGVLLLVANQLGLPPVPFYIFAGLLTGLVVEQEALIELALWGIAFLVFVFGIRVDLASLKSVLRDGEVAALTQLLVVAPVAVVIGYVLGTAFGYADPVRNALYFGAAATLSSTIVGSRILEEEIRQNLIYGRLAATIHFFDDLVAIGVVLVLSAEVLTDTQLVTSNIGYGLLFLLAGLVIYRHVFPLLVRTAEADDELVLMVSISILIAFLAAAEIVGISIVVGAFAAGIAVRGEGAQVLGVRNGIESIKDFFAAIFFVTVGALVAIPAADVLVFAVALVLLVVVLNPLVHTLAFIYEGYDGRTAFLASSSLTQVSELSLVIVIQALLLGTIAPGLFDAIILAAATTMILSTFLSRHEHLVYDTLVAPVLSTRTDYIDEQSDVDPDLSDHVVIVGYGRQGRRIVRELEYLDCPYVVIENDPGTLEHLPRQCANYVFGDAMAEYPLELAGVSEARLVVSTVEHRPVSRSLLALDVDADLILRTTSSREADDLLESGATFVTVPSVLAADQLVENVERVLGDESATETLETEHLEYLQTVQWEEQLRGRNPRTDH